MKKRKREAGMEDEDGDGSDDDEGADDDLLPGSALDDEEASLLRTARALHTSLTSTAKALPEFSWPAGKEEKLVEVIAHAKTLQKPADMIAKLGERRPDYLRKRDAPFVKLQAGLWNMVKLGVGSVDHVCAGNSSLVALEVLTLKACELFKKIDDMRKIETLGISRTVIEAEGDENAQRQLKTIQRQLEEGKELRTLQRGTQAPSRSNPPRSGSAPPASSSNPQRGGGGNNRRGRNKGKGRGGGGGKGPFFPKGPQSTSRSPNPGAGGH
jgi:hypothetical protein